MKYEITEEQILEIQNRVKEIKDLFPSVFKTKPIAGKWHEIKWKDGDIDIFFCVSIDGDNITHEDTFFRNGKAIDARRGFFSLSNLMTDDRRTLTILDTDKLRLKFK